MAFKHRDKKLETLTDSEIDAKTEAFASKADKPPPLTHKQSKGLDLSALSLEDLAKQYVEIDRQSHIIKGQILLEARKRFISNNEFGAWRSLNFNGRVTSQIATHLMNLAKFFNEIRPLGNIPISAGYLIAAPKLEDIANLVYERVTEIEKPSLNDVKEIIRALKPDVDVDVDENDNLEAALVHLNKMTKKQLIELLANNFNIKQLNKLISSVLSKSFQA